MSHAETGLKDVISKVWSLIWFYCCHKATEIKEPFKPPVCEYWPLRLPHYRTNHNVWQTVCKWIMCGQVCQHCKVFCWALGSFPLDKFSAP